MPPMPPPQTPSNDPPPDFSSRLTLILTTSPSPYHPSPTLLTTTLSSLKLAHPSLLTCPLILLFDGHGAVTDSSRVNTKNGLVDADLGQRYAEYQVRAKEWVSGPGGWTEEGLVEAGRGVDRVQIGKRSWCELEEVSYTHSSSLSTTASSRPLTLLMSTHQLGFALGVRSALQRVTTPYVLILQHDWAFVTPVPIAQLLDAMDREDGCPECVSETGSPDDEIRYPINYVGFVSNRIVEYEKRCVVARGLKAVTIRDFSTSPSIPLPTPSDPSSKTESPLPLCPLYFYFDKNHLARTHHLRHHIFSRGHFQRGDFIEDTYGHTLLTQLKSGQVSLRDSGCWLYYPDQGTVRAVRHLHGRKVAMSGERKGVVKESGEGLRLTRVGKGASSREDEDDFSIFDDSDDDDDGDHDTN